MKQPVIVGDVVQLNPETVKNKAFAACFMVVTEVREWGAIGYIQGIGKDRNTIGSQAWYRAEESEFEILEFGQATWRLER